MFLLCFHASVCDYTVIIMMCVFSACSGRHPGGNDEAALSGGVTGLCVQTAGDPGEKEV